MKKVHSFHQSKKIGDIGEQTILSWLEQATGWHSVIDVANNKEWYGLGIDIVIVKNPSEILCIDVKTDTYTAENNNLFIETWSNLEKRKMGWTKTTDAHRIIYLAPPTNRAILINTKNLPSIQAIAHTEGEKKKVWNYGYNSEGWTLNIDKIPSHLYTEILIEPNQQK